MQIKLLRQSKTPMHHGTRSDSRFPSQSYLIIARFPLQNPEMLYNESIRRKICLKERRKP